CDGVGRQRATMAVRRSGVGEGSLVRNEVPGVGPVVQGHPYDAVGGRIEHLAGRYLGAGGVKTRTTGAHDELANAEVGIRSTSRVELGEPFVPVRVAIEHDVDTAVVQVLPDLLVDRAATRAGGGRCPARVLVVRESAGRGVRGKVLLQPLLLCRTGRARRRVVRAGSGVQGDDVPLAHVVA